MATPSKHPPSEESFRTNAEPNEQLAFPMYVITLADACEVLKREGPIPCHEELVAEGKMRVAAGANNGRRIIFISHTWLGYKHPDPACVKSRVLADLLARIQNGTVGVGGFYLSSMFYKALDIPAAQLKSQYKDALIWLDFWSVPQRNPEMQALAIGTIVEYVNCSDIFVVLAGAWSHADNNTVRDQRAWSRRGWCRMEFLANALSDKVKSVIVAESGSSMMSYGPSGRPSNEWWLKTVGRGDFTVDADRFVLGPVIKRLIRRRQDKALAQGDLHWWRALHAYAGALLLGTGVDLERDESLSAWMATMKFNSVHDGESTGLTPLRYAVMACRSDLVAQLINMGADVNGRMRRPSTDLVAIWSLFDGQTVLGTALWAASSYNDSSCVELLLKCGADPRVVVQAAGGVSMLHLACVAPVGDDGGECVALIMRQSPDSAKVMCPALGMGLFALEEACFAGSLVVLEYILENHMQELFVERSAPYYGGRSRVAAIALMEDGSVEVLQKLLDVGADPNGFPEGQPIFRPLAVRLLLPVFRWLALTWTNFPSDFMDMVALYVGASPLHCAALRGNLGAVRLLIKHGAKVDSTNSGSPNLQMTPLMYAALRGHESIVEALLASAEDSGALIKAKDKRGKTAVEYAELRGHTLLAKKLKCESLAL